MIDLEKWIGIPYLPGGRTRAGVDCWGLLWLFYREELGIDLPRYEGQPDLAEMEELSHVVHASEEQALAVGSWRLVEKGDERIGDAVDISVMGNSHAGIFIPRCRMLHSRAASASCVEDLSRMSWRRRVRGIYRRVS